MTSTLWCKAYGAHMTKGCTFLPRNRTSLAANAIPFFVLNLVLSKGPYPCTCFWNT